MINKDEIWMAKALELAFKAQQQGDIPVGAIVVCDDKIVGQGFNGSIVRIDPSAHAEMIAIRQAAQTLGNYRLVDCTLYVTLEPCPMCAGLLVHSRIKRLVYGANDPRTGCAGSLMDLVRHPSLNHQVEVCAGVMQEACSTALSDFFRGRRKAKKLAKQANKV